MSFRRRFVVVLALAVALPLTAHADNWATARAVEQTSQGREHEARGDVETAERRYLEAIAFDGTYGPAYLALGGVQEKRGELAEAERSYSIGIDHVSGFASGFLARGRLRRQEKRLRDAANDVETASALRPDDLGTLRELRDVDVEAALFPAALAVTRRIVALAEAQHDAATAKEANLAVRALVVLVADLDPVVAGARDRGAVRNAIAVSAGARPTKPH